MFVLDTVEENILHMGARRGLSLYTQDRSRDAFDISEFAMGAKPQVDSPSKKVKQRGDFVEKAEDLIHVLFPHLDYREEDFASFMDIQDEQTMEVDGEDPVAGPSAIGYSHVNAVAGPSRLR
jgi:E3 ubiquitin-protein ligase SHPRH